MSFKNLAMINIPKTWEYISTERACKHNTNLILQRIQDLVTPLIDMTDNELELFDDNCLNYLKRITYEK